MRDVGGDWGRFSSHLAEILFDDSGVHGVDRQERLAVDRFEVLIGGVSAERMVVLARKIDSVLVPCLSGSSMLRVARLIEARFPHVISLMPRLAGFHGHLVRSTDVAEAFSIVALERLVKAIREEASRV